MAPGDRKSDGFALLVAAIGVAAIARFEINQRKMARIDPDTAKLDGLRCARKSAPPNELGYMAFARFGSQRLLGFISDIPK
jgi:hypothetical protein